MVEKRRPGQPAKPRSAADFNAVSLAAEDLQKRQLGSGTSTPRKAPPVAIVYVRNDSGSNRRKGDCLEVGTLLATQTLDEDALHFAGDLAVDAGAVSGVLRRALPDGESDELQVSGVAIAYVDVVDEDHTFCDVDMDEATLISSETGPHKILYKPNGENEQLCVVLLNCCLCTPSVGTGSGSDETGTGSDITGTGSDETGTGDDTGTGEVCISIPGVNMLDVPISTEPAYFLAIDENDCLVKVDIGNCDITGTGS